MTPHTTTPAACEPVELHWTTACDASPAPPRPAAVVGEIERFVQEVLARMPPDEAATARAGPGRPRVLPALALWTGLLVCVLRGFSSQQAVWRLLTAGHLWFYPRFPVTDQAVYNRLAGGGPAPLVRIFQQISAALAARLAPYAATALAPFATEVVVLDATKLDRIARRLPALREVPAGDVRLVPGQLAGRFDLRRQQWQRVLHIEDARQNEKVAARELLRGLPSGSLILADLGYFGFPWFDDLTERHYWWVSRYRLKTSYEVIHTYYANGDTFDGLVWLGAYRADRAKHAARLVQFRHQGTLYRYLSNVLDPTVLPLRDIAALYARRWDFELAVNLVKRHLKRHLWWSAKPVVIQQQVWAVLSIAQILHALQLEIAGRAGVDPFDVSLALLVEYAPRLAYAGVDPVTVFVEQGHALGFIRPSTRTTIQAPVIPPEHLAPRPPGVALIREPRYARRTGGKRPRKAKAAAVP